MVLAHSTVLQHHDGFRVKGEETAYCLTVKISLYIRDIHTTYNSQQSPTAGVAYSTPIPIGVRHTIRVVISRQPA
jgi:hypothetical protein